MRKATLLYLPTIIMLCLFFSCCKKNSTVNCSAYTYLIAGTDSFHLTSTPHSAAVINDSPRYYNVALTITEIDPCNISIGSTTLNYSARSKDSILIFGYNDGQGSDEYLSFNHYTHTISIGEDIHAGASGYIENDYLSF